MEIHMKYERDLYFMQQIYATIFMLANKLQVKGDKLLEALTTRQMMAMLAILHLPEGKATNSNIAKMLGTTRQSVKQLISIMEQKGYIKTVPSVQDKRASDVQITESGRKALLVSAERSFDLFADIFAQFTTEDLENLWILLKKLYHYDGDEQETFEKNVNYGVEEELTESQLQTVKNFELSRAKIEKEAKNLEKSK